MSYSEFRTKLQDAITNIIGDKLNSTKLSKSLISEYIKTGDSQPLLKYIDDHNDLKTIVKDERSLLKTVINQIDINKQNFKTNNPVTPLNIHPTTEKNATKIITSKDVDVISLIAGAVAVRRMAFIYAYLTLLEKIETIIPATVVPGPGPINERDITPEEEKNCKTLLAEAANRITNLRDIIQNLLMFHNEDVNLGMHYDLVKA